MIGWPWTSFRGSIRNVFNHFTGVSASQPSWNGIFAHNKLFDASLALTRNVWLHIPDLFSSRTALGTLLTAAHPGDSHHSLRRVAGGKQQSTASGGPQREWPACCSPLISSAIARASPLAQGPTTASQWTLHATLAPHMQRRAPGRRAGRGQP